MQCTGIQAQRHPMQCTEAAEKRKPVQCIGIQTQRHPMQCTEAAEKRKPCNAPCNAKREPVQTSEGRKCDRGGKTADLGHESEALLVMHEDA